jgi:predicted phosphodiesterase
VKLAVVSDIHGNLPALQAVLEAIAHEGVDQVVNLGDILSGPLLPVETADFLLKQDFVTIAGNHERQLLKVFDGPADRVDPSTSDGYAATQITRRHADWLRTLPPTLWLQDDLLLVHGTPGSDLVYWLETVTPDFGVHGSSGIRPATADEVAQRLASGAGAERASLVLCGHTHVPRMVQCGATLIVNPGSVGLQAYDDSHPHYHQVNNGAPLARYAIVARAGAGWQVRLGAVPYDWAPASRLAGRNGSAGWAYALATGRMPPDASTIGP